MDLSEGFYASMFLLQSTALCTKKIFFEQFFEKFFYFRVRRGMGDYSGFLQWLSLTSLSTNKIKKSLKLAFEVNTFLILGHCASVPGIDQHSDTFFNFLCFHAIFQASLYRQSYKFNNVQKIHFSASKNKRLFLLLFL